MFFLPHLPQSPRFQANFNLLEPSQPLFRNPMIRMPLYRIVRFFLFQP